MGKVKDDTVQEAVAVDVVQEAEEKKGPKMEKIFLFKDNNEYKDDVFVSVNGENYQIQRGIEVEVPSYIAEVLRNQQRQDQKAMDAGKEFKQ